MTLYFKSLCFVIRHTSDPHGFSFDSNSSQHNILFYRRQYELISEYNVGLKTLVREGLSEPEFYGDLVYKFKKLKGRNYFSFQFRKKSLRVCTSHLYPRG